jgi:hypothetical protein
MPPESSHGNLSPAPSRPTCAKSASARFSYEARSRRMRERCGRTISIGSRTLSSVVRQGSSVGAWNAMPAKLTGRVTGEPATATEPACGNCRPVTSFISVDLPQPDGPTTAANSPWPTAMSSFSTASGVPRQP